MSKIDYGLTNSLWSPQERQVLRDVIERAHAEWHESSNILEHEDFVAEALHERLTDEPGGVDAWEGDIFWEAVAFITESTY